MADRDLRDYWDVWMSRLSSAGMTLSCVLLAMMLVVTGTLAQMHMGSFEAQKMYFNSWWTFTDWGGWKIPSLPGGLTVGLLWLASLTASFVKRFRWRRQEAGILITHAGLILLLLGQFLTQWLSRESQLAMQIGESRNFSESAKDTELAIIKTSDPDTDEVTSVPEALFTQEGEIHPPRLPVYLVIRRFYRNAQLVMAAPGATSLANQGIGLRVSAQEAPPVASDDETNNVTAFVEVRQGPRSLGTWLVSSGLGAPQSFNAGGGEYRLTIRPKRIYYPYTLTLKAFHHDIYPGTDIPKNFSSLVHVSNPARNDHRDTLIYMNHPLRYEGKTFYQASFGEGDKLSVLQVMDNPVSVSPYLACAIVILGLLAQFLSHLIDFARSPR